MPVTGLELRINKLFREKNNWQFFILMFYNIVYRILFFHHSTSFKSRHIDRHMVRLIFLKHCREKLSFRNLIFGEEGWKHLDLLIFPTHMKIYFSVTESTFIVWNYVRITIQHLLFKISNNNSKIKYQICSKLTIEGTDVILVYLLLTLLRLNIMGGTAMIELNRGKIWKIHPKNTFSLQFNTLQGFLH